MVFSVRFLLRIMNMKNGAKLHKAVQLQKFIDSTPEFYVTVRKNRMADPEVRKSFLGG